MAEDKWKIIDTHVNSMIDWTKGLSVTPTSNQTPAAQRPGHIHRKSEPDVVMIRQAQTAQRIGQLPVPPQSAPVQPGTFTLDWSSRQLPARNDDPSIVESDIIPDKMMQLSELEAFKPTTSKAPQGNTMLSSQSRHNESSARNQPVSGSTDHEQTGYMGLEATPRPPPYPRGLGNGPVRPNRPFNGVGDTHIPHPRIQDNPYKAMITPRNQPTTTFGYQSPKSSRRSSVPANHIDPRGQSSSPNIPRRSTSIQPIMPRRRTQDNFLPSMLPPQELINPIPSHPIVTMPYSFTSTPKADSMIGGTSFTSKKPDDYEYTKALLQHQQDRMQRLQKELEAKKKLLESLNATVATKEKESCELRNEGLSKSMPTPEDINNLRRKNRHMEIECNCMIQEVELVSSGHHSMEGNFHDYIIKKVPSTRKRPVHPDPLPSPPLPPPPDPPVDPDPPDEDAKWSCKYCTFLNHSALDKCEVCEYRRHKAAAAS